MFSVCIVSACYAAKRMWKESASDAESCLAKDPAFIKGYYRLAIAQTKMGFFDEAIATLHAGLGREPGNDDVMLLITLSSLC